MKTFKSLAAFLAIAAALVGSAAAHAENGLQRAQKEGKIVVGIYNQAPWGWRDASGKLHGFDVDVIREALAPLGIKNIDVVVTQFPALIPSLQAGRFDAATGGLYITPQRCKLVAFTESTLKVPDAAVVRAGNPKGIHSFADIAKKNVVFGATRGSITAKHADMAGVPKDRQLLFQDNQSTMAALLAGRVDVMVSTSGAAVALLSDPKVKGLERVVPFAGVKDAAGHEIYGHVAVAFRKDDTSLRDAFDTQIAKMKSDGRLAAIMKRYGFSDAETASPTPRAKLCAG